MHKIFPLPPVKVIGVIALLFFAGCATKRVNWEARIGTYTYDNAVLELGPPDKDAKLQDGTLVAEWVTSRGGTFIHPAYGFHEPLWYATPAPPTYVDAPDYILRLTFDPQGVLRAWKRFAR